MQQLSLPSTQILKFSFYGHFNIHVFEKTPVKGHFMDQAQFYQPFTIAIKLAQLWHQKWWGRKKKLQIRQLWSFDFDSSSCCASPFSWVWKLHCFYFTPPSKRGKCEQRNLRNSVGWVVELIFSQREMQREANIFILLFKRIFYLFEEKKWGHVWGAGAEREQERILHRLCSGHRAWLGAELGTRSHDSRIVTWAKTKSQRA